MDNTDYLAKLLWLMYRNARNLLPYRTRMENLTWRMMSVQKAKKLQQRQRQKNGSKLELSSFITSPLLEQLNSGDTPQTSASAEEFDYVAHIRRMSRDVKSTLPRAQNQPQHPSQLQNQSHIQNQNPNHNLTQNRKRPASSLPFLLATTPATGRGSNPPVPTTGMAGASNLRHNAASASNTSIHLNLSAALKDTAVPSNLYGQGHGFSFLLDPLAYEGPNQNFTPSVSNANFSNGSALQAYAESLSSSSYRGPQGQNGGNFSNGGQTNNGNFERPGYPGRSSSSTSIHRGTSYRGHNYNHNNTNNHNNHNNNNTYTPGSGSYSQQNTPIAATNSIAMSSNNHPSASNFSGILPQPMGSLARATPSLLYDPSYFSYPVGPSAILLGSLGRQDHSLVNVADHFNNLRLHTPYDFDDLASVVSASNLGFPSDTFDNYGNGTSVSMSLVDPGSASVQEIESSMYFESHGRPSQKVPSGDAQGQILHPQLHSLFAHGNSVGTSWAESFFDGTPPPGSVPTTVSAATPVNAKMSVLPKKKSKKIKTKDSNKQQQLNNSSGAETSSNTGTPNNASKSTSNNSAATLNSPTANLRCTNCDTKTTPLWRRNPQGEPLCNACGLFLKLHGTVRPRSLKTDVIKKRQRGQGSSSLSRKGSLVNVTSVANTRASVSSSVGKNTPARDGDDFNPTPINKQGSKPNAASSSRSKSVSKASVKASKPASRPKTALEPQSEYSVNDLGTQFQTSGGNPGQVPESSFHFTPLLIRDLPLDSIHEFGKDGDWPSMVQKDNYVDDGDEKLSQWDWLSMNL